MLFKIPKKASPSLIRDAPWIFRSEIEVDISASDCMSILKDDQAWQFWHPEVMDIKWRSVGKDGSRTVVFKDILMMILLLGPITLEEQFDIWEENKIGFYFSRTSRPSFLTYQQIREEFEAVPLSNNKCKFIRTVAMEPSFLPRYLLGWIIYPYLKRLFEEKCPQRFLNAIKSKKLPRN